VRRDAGVSVYPNRPNLATIKMVQPPKIRILAVGHNPLLREGLSLLIRLQPDMELVGAAASAEEAVQAFAAHRPDVTLMDLDLPCAAAITAIQEIVRLVPAACILGLMTYEQDVSARHALRAGARSCLTKDRLNQELAALVRNCARAAD
jgi:DNA-binding NarL/FixJ family response regulator